MAKWVLPAATRGDVVEQLLLNRGVKPADFSAFLQPDYERDTFAFEGFKEMTRAVERVMFALKTGEKIVIHGDYDADGVSGATILYTTLTEIAEKLSYAAVISVYLPDRELDGYGVAMHTVERLAAEGTKVLITVDCGIANGLELGRATELGMESVVCDHHQMGEYYPATSIVLHPLAPGEDYQNKVLCGTGVAFKFASALLAEARRLGADFPVGHEKWLLDLVAIATVTDVMPLLGENRALEHFGLKVLRKTRRPGIRAMLRASATELAQVDTQVIGFRIGPRLNAAGRLASARLAFETLAARTDEEAIRAAATLEALNKQRQQVFQHMYQEALLQARAMEADQVLCVYSPDWLPGIVGLIAGRLVGDFGKPCFAFTKVGEKLVASGRSVGGLHLVEAMMACPSEIFLKRGGHPQACGLTLVGEGVLPAFREGVNAYTDRVTAGAGVQALLQLDAALLPSEATLDLADHLQALEPFGEGNRAPIWYAERVKVTKVTPMGAEGQHVRLVVEDETGVSDVVAFSFKERLNEVKIGAVVDLAYELGVNEWNGVTKAQLRLVDVRAHGSPVVMAGASLAPGTEGELGGHPVANKEGSR
jgi:single-stranded-DNA-specific exonuclease